MPKDFIHFKIAQITADQLEGTQYTSCLKKHEDGLLLGSIFHDAMFYAVTPKGKPLETLSHALHGKEGQDTFELIRTQARHAKATTTSTLPSAVLVGLVSHLYADVVIHPLVWHLTGQYYAENAASKSQARRHHRALESLMDMVACPDMIGRTRYRIRTLLRRCPDFLNTGIPIDGLSLLAKMPLKTTRKCLASAWTIYSLLQWAYAQPTLARILFALRNELPSSIAEIGMLFYAPQLLTQSEQLQGTINYTHPATDAKLAASLEQLMHTAATKAASLCRQLEPAVFGDAPIHIPGPGPSMDAGVAGVSTQQMTSFSDVPFPNLK